MLHTIKLLLLHHSLLIFSEYGKFPIYVLLWTSKLYRAFKQTYCLLVVWMMLRGRDGPWPIYKYQIHSIEINTFLCEGFLF